MVSSLSSARGAYSPAQLSVAPLPQLDEYAQCLLLPETAQDANKMSVTHINTLSVTKYTKEDDDGSDENNLSEAKGPSTSSSQDILCHLRLHFEHKLCLASELEN